MLIDLLYRRPPVVGLRPPARAGLLFCRIVTIIGIGAAYHVLADDHGYKKKRL